MATLKYGTDSSVYLELAEGTLSVECVMPRAEPLDDLTSAAADALRNPLEYPPLTLAVTPADRVVLALDHGLPQIAQITAAVVEALLDADVDPDGITIVQTQADVEAGSGDPRRMLPDTISEQITLFTHDPADRDQLAFLAASDSGEAILISRAIQNADMVLPIGCLHNRTAAGYFGVHGTVFPGFSDEKTLRRFRSLAALETDGKHKKTLVSEVEHVAWLLGINFTIQLVPARHNGVSHVLAGKSDAVARRGNELYHAAWGCSVPGLADLVVAAIEGDSRQQTWKNLGRALDAATALVEDGGAIALCCELDAHPGPAIQQLIGSPSREDAMRQIRKHRPHDALPAAQLVRAIDRGTVYLLSRLDPSLVEELDMIHVADPDDLARLARRYESAILLPDAAFAAVTVSPN